MNTKLFYGISAAVLLLLLGIGGYFAYQKTSVAQIPNTAAIGSVLDNNDVSQTQNQTTGGDSAAPLFEEGEFKG